MFVTEQEYDQWDSTLWDDLAHEDRRCNTCATCAHDGQCDDLPNCGGSCWTSAFSDCPQCGESFLDEGDWQSENGEHSFCSEGCLESWLRDHAEEEEELEEEEEAEDGE